MTINFNVVSRIQLFDMGMCTKVDQRTDIRVKKSPRYGQSQHGSPCYLIVRGSKT